MRDLIVLLVHLVSTVLRLARSGGLRSVVAESVLLKHQLLIVNRSRRRAPNLRVVDRLIAGFCSLWITQARLLRAAIVLKPSTLLHFHRALVQRKYRLLFSPKQRPKPGPRGPKAELIRAVVAMKERNPTWGCPRIAEQITLAFGIPINKDAVRRIWLADYRPVLDGGSVLADIPRQYERQPVECGSLAMRIRDIADVLGDGSDGPVQSPDYRIWNSTGSRRRCSPLPDV